MKKSGILMMILATGMALGLSACCEPCNKPDYGTFELRQEAINRMAFKALDVQQYISSNGDKVILSYFDPESGLQEGNYDCDPLDRCGLCCATFLSDYYYIQLADADNQKRFEFLLENDFSVKTPEDPNDSIPARLVIVFNGDVIRGDIEDVENATLTEEVELIGKTYRNVISFSTATPPFYEDPGVAVKFWFSFNLGIVGFEYADGTVWRLE